MPVFEITTPEGKKLRVTAPEGTTREQALERVKSEYQRPETVERQAPGREPLNYSEMMRDSLGNVASAAMRSGPVGAMGSAAQEAVGNMGKLMDRGGYQAGGYVTDALAPHVSPEIAGAAGYATNVGVQAIPTIAGAIAGNMAKPGFEAAGKKLMQSALKPGVAELRSGNADRAIQTLLDEGVNVTRGGAEKLQGSVDDLDKIVSQLIDNSPATISQAYPASAISDTLQTVRSQVNPLSDVDAVIGSWDEFSKTFPGDLPAKLAHALKQGTYQSLKGKYGEIGSASTEAQKALARGLREGIADAIPETSGLLKKEGDLLNALALVERRAGVAGNRDLAGLASLAENPKAAALMLADRSQLIKSLLARLLYSGAGKSSTAAGAGIGGSLGYSQAEQRE